MVGNNYRRLKFQVLVPLIDAQKNHFLKKLKSFPLQSQQIYLVKGLGSEKVKLAINPSNIQSGYGSLVWWKQHWSVC